MDGESVKTGITVIFWIAVYIMAVMSDVEEKEPITRIIKTYWPHFLFLIVMTIVFINI